MSRPPDMPPAQRWPHGVRSRYVAGCRCDACRAANTLYNRKRARLNAQGQGNPIIDASRVLEHLRNLQALGVGTRSVAIKAGINRNPVSLIRGGRKTKIRKLTAVRLLAVDESAKRERTVPAAETWRRIEALIEMGWSKRRINHALGFKGDGLQLRKTRISVENEQRVWQLLFDVVQQRSYASAWRSLYTYREKAGVRPAFSMETIFSRYFKDRKYRWQQ